MHTRTLLAVRPSFARACSHSPCSVPSRRARARLDLRILVQPELNCFGGPRI